MSEQENTIDTAVNDPLACTEFLACVIRCGEAYTEHVDRALNTIREALKRTDLASVKGEAVLPRIKTGIPMTEFGSSSKAKIAPHTDPVPVVRAMVEALRKAEKVTRPNVHNGKHDNEWIEIKLAHASGQRFLGDNRRK